MAIRTEPWLDHRVVPICATCHALLDFSNKASLLAHLHDPEDRAALERARRAACAGGVEVFSAD